MGGAAPRPAPAWHARPGGGRRRRRAGTGQPLRDVFPATRHQRDWVHKLANVLGRLPKAVQAGARKALAEVRDAPDRDHAQRAIEAFARDYEIKWPKAVAKIVDDAEELLCFFDFPAEHWGHLKTSNPIESTSPSVRLRTRVTKGPGKRPPGWRWRSLLESAQDRCGRSTARVPGRSLRAGARFDKGVMVERLRRARRTPRSRSTGDPQRGENALGRGSAGAGIRQRRRFQGDLVAHALQLVDQAVAIGLAGVALQEPIGPEI